MLLKLFLILLVAKIVTTYDCSSYDDPTTCVTTEHVMCAYCVDYNVCGEYNPCDNTFVDIVISCNNIIINSNVTPYLETCATMTIGDYCTIIFILVAILCIIYVLINNAFIKNKCEEFEKPCNILFLTLCTIITISLTIIFTLYRLILTNVSKYFDSLYSVLKDLTIIITVLLLITIIISIFVILLSYLIRCIINKTNDTKVGEILEKILNFVPCLAKILLPEKKYKDSILNESPFDSNYEDF